MSDHCVFDLLPPRRSIAVRTIDRGRRPHLRWNGFASYKRGIHPENVEGAMMSPMNCVSRVRSTRSAVGSRLFNRELSGRVGSGVALFLVALTAAVSGC